ncbi:chaperone protein clpb1, partial [Phtheirospermum japonicum]
FYDKSYQLRWALVELIELYRDNHPDSQYWVDRLRLERDRASIFMYDFLNRWEFVVRSSAGFGILTRKCAEKLPIVVKENACPDVAQFLDDIHGQLIRRLGCLLTVEACHVAEVVSNLTDVPPTQILPSINDQKQQEAMHMMNQRLVNQEHVIREVLETLVSPKRRSNTLPRGSFLLLGPSGVGKTEIAKAVAEQWYCDASRLVEIDLSDYVEPAACDLSEWSNGKHEALWSRLTEVVAKRPYSVILMDKIDKASPSVTRVLLEVLSNEAPIDLDGNPADFSNSIIFMTSSVGSNQLALLCKCHNPNKDLWIQFVRNPLEFRKTHDCTLEGSGPGRALTEARCFFTDELLNSVDKVLVVERFRNYKAVFRLLLREIVRELTGQRFVVHASDAALNSLFGKSLNHYLEEGGKSFKQLLLEHVIPHLPAAEDLKNVVLYVDTLVGTRELSFRLEKLEPYVDDWYFKLKDGTFDKSITNLRIKLEAVRRILNARSLYLSLLDCKGHGNSSLLLQISVDICKEILMWSPPFPEQPPRDKVCSFLMFRFNAPHSPPHPPHPHSPVTQSVDLLCLYDICRERHLVCCPITFPPLRKWRRLRIV